MWKSYFEWEKRCSHYLKDRSITYLRLSLALIYFWYGLLKIFGITPCALDGMISDAVQWVDLPFFVRFLGVWEALIGICLAVKKWQKWGILLLFLQFPGTFLPLFMNPSEYFSPLPFGLTLEAKYIIKNLVYVAAGLVLIGSLDKSSK